MLADLRGLLGQLERKNGWTLAEAAGEVSPDGMQRLLRTADWNADAVGDELRSYVVERLGPGGVLIVDETGFVKKGTRSAGVADQLGVPLRTLYNWRTSHVGPRAVRVGKHLCYRPAEVERWVDEQTETAPRAGIGSLAR